MKRLILIALVAIPIVAAGKADIPAYIRQYSSLAVSEMNRSGVPASITMAQAILESASGTSRLAVKANNHFGIKCGNSWNGPSIRHDDDLKHECFRVYASPEQSWIDHSDFLRSRERYAPLFELERSDYRSWAKGLKECGYATDRGYAAKLIELIEEYRLYELDGGICPVGPTDVDDVMIAEPMHGGIKSFDERESIVMDRQIQYDNGRPYVIASYGETYKSIAVEYGLFVGEILRFNDAKRGMEPSPGDVVYLKKATRK